MKTPPKSGTKYESLKEGSPNEMVHCPGSGGGCGDKLEDTACQKFKGLSFPKQIKRASKQRGFGKMQKRGKTAEIKISFHGIHTGNKTPDACGAAPDQPRNADGDVKKALLLSDDEQISIMLGEEDHIRINA